MPGAATSPARALDRGQSARGRPRTRFRPLPTRSPPRQAPLPEVPGSGAPMHLPRAARSGNCARHARRQPRPRHEPRRGRCDTGFSNPDHPWRGEAPRRTRRRHRSGRTRGRRDRSACGERPTLRSEDGAFQPERGIDRLRSPARVPTLGWRLRLGPPPRRANRAAQSPSCRGVRSICPGSGRPRQSDPERPRAPRAGRPGSYRGLPLRRRMLPRSLPHQAEARHPGQRAGAPNCRAGTRDRERRTYRHPAGPLPRRGADQSPPDQATRVRHPLRPVAR